MWEAKRKQKTEEKVKGCAYTLKRRKKKEKGYRKH